MPEHRDGGGDGIFVRGLGNRGCASTPDTAESAVLQGVWGCTTLGADAIPEIVHLVGTAVEHLGADGTWTNGWTVTDMVNTSIGTRYRIVSDADYRVVGSDQIRPCPEVA